MSHRNSLGKCLFGDDKTPGAWQRTIGSNLGPFATLIPLNRNYQRPAPAADAVVTIELPFRRPLASLC